MKWCPFIGSLKQTVFSLSLMFIFFIYRIPWLEHSSPHLFLDLLPNILYKTFYISKNAFLHQSVVGPWSFLHFPAEWSHLLQAQFELNMPSLRIWGRTEHRASCLAVTPNFRQRSLWHLWKWHRNVQLKEDLLFHKNNEIWQKSRPLSCKIASKRRVYIFVLRLWAGSIAECTLKNISK